MAAQCGKRPRRIGTAAARPHSHCVRSRTSFCKPRIASTRSSRAAARRSATSSPRSARAPIPRRSSSSVPTTTRCRAVRAPPGWPALSQTWRLGLAVRTSVHVARISDGEGKLAPSSGWPAAGECRPPRQRSASGSTQLAQQILSNRGSYEIRAFEVVEAYAAGLRHNLGEAAVITRSAALADWTAWRPDLLFIDPPGLRSDRRPNYPTLESLLHHLAERGQRVSRTYFSGCRSSANAYRAGPLCP
jgi:hypothetical protein